MKEKANFVILNLPKYKKIVEESAKIAVVLNAILAVVYFIVSLYGVSASLLSKTFILFFVLGFAFCFFWLSAIITHIATWWLSKIYWLSFLLCIGIGVCLALLSLMFSEIFFIWDSYFIIFIVLGVIGGTLVFMSQKRLKKLTDTFKEL